MFEDIKLPDETAPAPRQEPKLIVGESLIRKPNYAGYLLTAVVGVVFGFLLADSSIFKDGGGQDGDQQEQRDEKNDEHHSSAKLANAYVLIIEESSERTPQVARLLGNSAYFDSLGSRKITWRVYDKDSPDAKSYVEAAEKVGLPAILILTKVGNEEKGTLVAAKSSPPTTELLDEWIRKVTGL